jgi:putative peptidoglycan lipid II flippase
MSDTGRRIFKASLAIMAAHLVFKFAGLVQYRLIGRYCDPTLRDLFVFGFESVLTTIYLVGEEGLGPAFLPIFMQEKDKRGDRAAWRFAGTLLSVQAIFILLTTAMVMWQPEWIVRLLTDWESEGMPAVYMERAPWFARWMIPGLLGLSIGSTTYLLLNGHKRFFLAAFGDASVKFVLIGALIAGVAIGGELGFWLTAGVVAGSAAKVLTHLVGLRREVRLLRPNLDVRSPAFKQFLWLVLPLMVGILFAKVRDLHNETYILTYTGEEGLLSINSFGRKLFKAAGWLVPYSASIAMYPFFCELVDRDDKKELARLITTACHVILVLCVPLSALVVALSLPLTRLIFQDGRFDLGACELAAVSNACYTLVFPAYALEYVFMQAYFSNRRMWTPIILGLVFSSISVGLSYLGVVHWGLGGASALASVALAYTVSRMGKTLSLAILTKRFLPHLDGKHAFSFSLRIGMAGGVCGIAAYAARRLAESWTDIHAGDSVAGVLRAVLPPLIAGSLAGLAAYLATLRILCREEWRQTAAWTRARLAARRNRDGDDLQNSAD